MYNRALWHGRLCLKMIRDMENVPKKSQSYRNMDPLLLFILWRQHFSSPILFVMDTAWAICFLFVLLGWQPRIQEGVADWDEDWDKYDDEGKTL